MIEREITIRLQAYKNSEELPDLDAALLNAATASIVHSYSPYSGFKVAAAVLLENGEIVTGTNQENAAFPVGICAEGTALSACSALYPNIAVKAIAVTVKAGTHIADHPVAPCGVCRQRIAEYEQRFGQSIAVIMRGETGEIYKVDSIQSLLPLGFSKKDL